MKRISASEANRNFSAVLGKVKAGQEFVVTSRGTPVARFIPFDNEEEKRKKARKALFERLDRQKPMNLKIDWTRDDLYERDF
jgi:prevent-host-death family protein